MGGIGHLAAFSFHETKNITSGEGGMLVINDARFNDRAEIVREMGINRSKFFRGEIDKYGWVDIGSSFLPSEIIAAFLFAQLESLDEIQVKRRKIWNQYNELLRPLDDTGLFKFPFIPGYATNNAYMFYLICASLKMRTKMINDLKNAGISSVFHYISLHKSKFYYRGESSGQMPLADYYTDHLLRLPFFYSLTEEQIISICKAITQTLR